MSKKRNWQNRKKNFKKGGGGGGGGAATALMDEPVIDVDALPADLTEEELEELVASLPKSTRKTKPKAVSYLDVVNENMADLHEVAVKEKLEVEGLRRRRDLVWAITNHRLQKHVPVTTSGCLEVVSEKQAFLRLSENSYLATEEDVFVPRSLIQRYSLRTGMTVVGELRPVKEGEKYFALQSIKTVDDGHPDEVISRTPFKELVPLYPEERLLLEGAPENPLEMRIADLVTPIGRGQRGLIVAPPRTGKTVLLHQIANSIVANAPDAHLIILLVDERPEEVTDFQRSIPEGKREVVSSTFDETSARHLRVANMVIEKARSMVESGKHVIILLDSITRLARASNNEAPSNGKLLSGGIEATALQFPKRFFGSARNIEDGGSLTILGTALVETGSKMDEVIF